MKNLRQFVISIFILTVLLSTGTAETYCNTLPEWNDLKDSRYGSYTKNDATQIVTDNKINVRTGPGTSYEKTFQLNAGDKVVVLEENKATLKAEGAVAHWYKIECDKGIGYLCARWLSNNWQQGDIDGDGKDEYLAVQFFNDIPPDYEGDWPEDDGYSYWVGNCLYINDGEISVHKEIRVSKESDNEILGFSGFDILDNAGFIPAVSLIAVMRSARYGSGSSQEVQLYYYKPASGTFEKITQFGCGWEVSDCDYATVYLPGGRLEVCSGPSQFISSEHEGKNHLLINKRHFEGSWDAVPPRADSDKNENWIWNGTEFLRKAE